jgi:hypothetical protein
VQELERLLETATQKRNQWHDIRSGKIRFASEAEKVLHLEGTWIRWKRAVADLNAYKNNGSRISSSPKQGETIRIAIRELTPPRSVPSQR